MRNSLDFITLTFPVQITSVPSWLWLLIPVVGILLTIPLVIHRLAHWIWLPFTATNILVQVVNVYHLLRRRREVERNIVEWNRCNEE